MSGASPGDDGEESDDRYGEEACAVIDSLEQIGSQWRLIVLDDLQETGFVDRRLEEDDEELLTGQA